MPTVRKNNGQYITSGNPRGRPPVSLSLADAIRRRFPPERIVDMVEKLADDAKDERVRLAALQIISDRGYGKVLTEIEVTQHAPQAAVNWSAVAPERRRAMFDTVLEIEAVAGVTNGDEPSEH